MAKACQLLQQIKNIHESTKSGLVQSDSTTLWATITQHAYATIVENETKDVKLSPVQQFNEWAKDLTDLFGGRVASKLRDVWEGERKLRKLRKQQRLEKVGTDLAEGVSGDEAAWIDYDVDENGNVIEDSVKRSKFWTKEEIESLKDINIDIRKRIGLTTPEYLLNQIDSDNNSDFFKIVLQKFNNQEFLQKTESKEYKTKFIEAMKGVDPKRVLIYSVIKNAEATNQTNVINMLRDVDKVDTSVVDNITTKELAAYRATQEIYRDMYRNINEARVAAGQDALPFSMDYVTFSRVSESLINDGSNMLSATVGKIMQKFAYENPRMFNSSIPEHLKKKYLKDTKFKYERRGESIKALDLNFPRVMNAYIENATRYVHMSPIKQMMNELLGNWNSYELVENEEGNKEIYHKVHSVRDITPHISDALTEWTNFVVTGHQKDWLADKSLGRFTVPKKVTDKFNLPPMSGEIFYEKVARGLTRNIANSTLGYSLRSVAVQPLANLLTYTIVGNKSLFKGTQAYFNKEAREFALKNSKHLSVRNADVELDSSLDLEAGAKGGVKHALKVFWNSGFKWLQAADSITATMGWLAAYDAVSTQGLIGQEAFDAADAIVRKTHVAASNVFRAPIQRHTTGRALTLFQTFSIGEFNFMLNEVISRKNMRDITGKRVIGEEAKKLQRQRIVRLLIGTAIANAIFEELLGLDTPLPSPVRAFAKSMQEDKTLVRSFINSSTEIFAYVPILGGGVQYGSGVGGAVGDFYKEVMKVISDQPGPKKGALELLARGGGVRGTSQLMKMYKYGWPWNADKPLPVSTFEFMIGSYSGHKRLLIDALVEDNSTD